MAVAFVVGQPFVADRNRMAALASNLASNLASVLASVLAFTLAYLPFVAVHKVVAFVVVHIMVASEVAVHSLPSLAIAFVVVDHMVPLPSVVEPFPWVHHPLEPTHIHPDKLQFEALHEP